MEVLNTALGFALNEDEWIDFLDDSSVYKRYLEKYEGINFGNPELQYLSLNTADEYRLLLNPSTWIIRDTPSEELTSVFRCGHFNLHLLFLAHTPDAILLWPTLMPDSVWRQFVPKAEKSTEHGVLDNNELLPSVNAVQVMPEYTSCGAATGYHSGLITLQDGKQNGLAISDYRSLGVHIHWFDANQSHGPSFTILLTYTQAQQWGVCHKLSGIYPNIIYNDVPLVAGNYHWQDQECTKEFYDKATIEFISTSTRMPFDIARIIHEY
jgi:hypothetical protein